MLDEYLFHRRKPHSGCLSTLDECFFHIRSSFRMSVYGGWMPLSHKRTLFRDTSLCSLATQLNDKMIRVLNFSMLVAKPRRGRFNNIQNRDCCKHECQDPCFKQEIWAPINSNSRGLLPVATRQLQGSSSSFCQLVYSKSLNMMQ